MIPEKSHYIKKIKNKCGERIFKREMDNFVNGPLNTANNYY